MKIVKKFIIVSFIAFASCNNAVNKIFDGQEDVPEDTFPIVFKSKALQDTLVKFINDVDSFPNPYGPPIYTIIYEISRSDSCVTLHAHGMVLDFAIKDQEIIQYIPAGALEHNGKVIAAAYDPQLSKSVYSVIDSAQFSMDIYKRHWDYWPPVEWDVCSSMRRYKFLYPDSLQVRYIRKSKYEDPSAHGMLGLVTFDAYNK